MQLTTWFTIPNRFPRMKRPLPQAILPLSQNNPLKGGSLWDFRQGTFVVVVKLEAPVKLRRYATSPVFI
ncbi:hypothetical protein BKG67_19400 [Mycobacteroides chelonae]|nr:hypothetical protein BKG66_20850 [Mycobacteroides chelonae]OHT68835.1 hypothetical protein BKG67_19400 [Mycobacteroides chelonae]